MNNKLRKENIVWTISEDYSYIPIINLFDKYDDFKMDYYKMSILGILYKTIDMDNFMEFISNCVQKTELKNEFLKVVEIFLDDCLSLKLISQRSGIEDFKNYFYEKIIDKYEVMKDELGEKFFEDIDVEEEIEYVYYNSISKNHVTSRDVVEEMVVYLRKKAIKISDEILNFSNMTTSELVSKSDQELITNVEDTTFLNSENKKANYVSEKICTKFDDLEHIGDENVDFMNSSKKDWILEEIKNSINAIFLKYFYKNIRSNAKNRLEDSDSKSDKKKSIKAEKDKSKPDRLNFKMKKKKISDLKDGDNIGSFSIESAEFTGQLSDDAEINDERLKKNVDPKVQNSNSKIREMILARYGESIYPEYMTNFLESKICTGIHEGIKLHFTQGKFLEGKYDKYFANSIQNQREKNIEYYNDNELIFRRSINELKEIIRKKIFLEDSEEILSKSGELIVSKIWRNKIFGDENIFKKVSKENVGDISVDILLDSSASQIGREEVVSSQAYVISEALVSLNIPTRVYGFCNFFNYLVMREYRDYKDPITSNKNIFSYKTSGSNRDGLAIKFISKQMDTLENTNKVLIILSDGRPNDKIDLGTVGFMKVDGQDYEGENAIKDTASEVFNTKMKGSNVLGVFTGLIDDLEDEKKIYGKDFAYIKRLDRFSHIIGFYLEQLIT